MTKIKNFRVNLRSREVARWLKKERGLETTPDLELTIAEGIKEIRKWISPAAVYTTLTRHTAEKTTPISMPAEAVAVSIAAISIGPNLEAERERSESGSGRQALLEALEREALQQAMQFAVRLVAEQAEEDDCEMSPPVLVEDVASDPGLLSPLATLLGVARIGIQLDPAAHQTPPYVRLFYWFWTPAAKGPSRRAQPAGRAEKVAA